MKYYYLNTGANNGKYNMDYDIHLAKICKPGEFYLRLYRWNPYCISLGENQKYESINIKKASDNKIDIVKRPTGGRAILHSEELTYSVITFAKVQKSLHHFYNEINKALITGLLFYNDRLTKIELETEQPDFPKIYNENKENMCFATTAKSEIKFEGKKLVGSAQRKLGNYLLQHGSILCGSYHKNLISYFNLSNEKILDICNRINDITTDLESILNENIDFTKLKKSIKRGFENHFGDLFTEVSLNYGNEELTAVYQVL